MTCYVHKTTDKNYVWGLSARVYFIVSSGNSDFFIVILSIKLRVTKVWNIVESDVIVKFNSTDFYSVVLLLFCHITVPG